MPTVADRISQLSSVASVYGGNIVYGSTAVLAATGLVPDSQSNSDNAIGALHQLDEMTRLMLVATRGSTGAQITSTSQSNQVAFSTGVGLLASTRYACSGQP
jgi:hypothetical protein